MPKFNGEVENHQRPQRLHQSLISDLWLLITHLWQPLTAYCILALEIVNRKSTI